MAPTQAACQYLAQAGPAKAFPRNWAEGIPWIWAGLLRTWLPLPSCQSNSAPKVCCGEKQMERRPLGLWFLTFVGSWLSFCGWGSVRNLQGLATHGHTLSYSDWFLLGRKYLDASHLSSPFSASTSLCSLELQGNAHCFPLHADRLRLDPVLCCSWRKEETRFEKSLSPPIY